MYRSVLEASEKGESNYGDVNPENFGIIDYVLSDEELERREYLETEKLVTAAGIPMGFKVTWSNNVGDFSRGEPYSKNDKRFNPLHRIDDAYEVMFKLEIDSAFDSKNLNVTASKNGKSYTFDGESKRDAFCKAVTHCAASLN